jgi:hypothetical protein
VAADGSVAVNVTLVRRQSGSRKADRRGRRGLARGLLGLGAALRFVAGLVRLDGADAGPMNETMPPEMLRTP